MGDRKKQAVLLIHGIGEQRPMQTLRSFVDAVWSTDEEVHHEYGSANVWSKPDTISGNFELRRLTTGKNRENIRTDFFEFYWAHLMEGTSASHVAAWAKILLLRWPWFVPRQLRGAWILLVSMILLIGFLAMQTVLPEAWRIITIPKWMTGTAGILVTWITMPIIKNIIGDAARYLNPSPGNIKRRQEIRTRGVQLLQKLHEAKYERIIVVGHSLGSVIGYDILTYAWALYNKDVDGKKAHPKLDKLEKDIIDGPLSSTEYQARQRELFDELVENGSPWRVTDFLTLGSPLALAALLLANDKTDLEAKQESREFPKNPPVLENGKFSYPAGSEHRTLHHAAVFGPTRWTNLFFPSCCLIWGDIIGGRLLDLFGWGVRDVPVTTHQRSGLLSHTLYWSLDPGSEPGSHIKELRAALNLLNLKLPSSGNTENTEKANDPTKEMA